MKPNRILLSLALFMGWLAGQNVGIGTSSPTERLHVAGNLRLDNAFMPGNQAGAVGNILLSQGPGAAPVWLPNGTAGSILMSMGAGNNPVWAPNPICATPTQNRFIKFTSTSPTSVCNTTLAENANGNIWNADGNATPVAGVDKFEIIGTGAMPYAINGYTTADGAYGVYGQATGANGVGVFGITNQATGVGVQGVTLSADGTAGFFVVSVAAGGGSGDGVVGVTGQSAGFAVWGAHTNTTGGTAVVGSNAANIWYFGAVRAGGSFTGTNIGVGGFAEATTGTAGRFVLGPTAAGGASTGTNAGLAVIAHSAQRGGATIAAAMQGGAPTFYANAVVSAYHDGGNGPGGVTPVGVIGRVPANSNGQAIRGENPGNGPTDYAVYANGNLAATGGKSFLIDHPLDPENKFLRHFCMEGPEPYNVYRGVVTTDAQGRAVVELPSYFEAANRDYTYHLTPVGAIAQVAVIEEVRNNRFVIQSDRPNLKVSWMVMAVRNDPYARYFASPAEQEKPDYYRGKYLIPQVYGKSEEYAVFRPVQANLPEAKAMPVTEKLPSTHLPKEKLKLLENK